MWRVINPNPPKQIRPKRTSPPGVINRPTIINPPKPPPPVLSLYQVTPKYRATFNEMQRLRIDTVGRNPYSGKLGIKFWREGHNRYFWVYGGKADMLWECYRRFGDRKGPPPTRIFIPPDQYREKLLLAANNYTPSYKGLNNNVSSTDAST